MTNKEMGLGMCKKEYSGRQVLILRWLLLYEKGEKPVKMGKKIKMLVFSEKTQDHS